jgi:hypothetical protein
MKTDGKETIASKLNREERLHLLEVEMQILQSRFDKYDNLIHQTRNWFNAILLALFGAALTTRHPYLIFVGMPIAVFFYLLELIWRIEYWHQYVVRYRHIRDTLNISAAIESISVYDLTNHYGWKPTLSAKLLDCVKNVEMVFFYGFWFAFAAVAYHWL